jgi:hypothetical protein
MTVTLRLLDAPPADAEDWEPGRMWPRAVRLGDGTVCAGWWVILCDAGDRPVLWHTAIPAQNGSRWEVTGQPPKITVRPSINVIGVWHGWITDGELVPA